MVSKKPRGSDFLCWSSSKEKRYKRGLIEAPCQDVLRHFPLRASRSGDQPFRMDTQEIEVDAGPVIEPIEVCRAGQLHEVLVTGQISRQDHQVVPTIRGTGNRLLVGHPAWRDIGLAAEDGHHPGGTALRIEFDGAEHIAVIGERQSRHPELDRALDHLADARGAVQQRVLAVVMQMNEVGVFHGDWNE